MSKEWKVMIDTSDIIWKEKMFLHFPNSYTTFSSQTDAVWHNIFIETWKDEMSNCWIEITKKTNQFKDKGRHIIHGDGTYYLPVRTKRGILNDRFR